jgi:hypothetical protein
MHEDGDMEDTVGVEVEVLNPVVFEHPLEEVAHRQCESALHEPHKHQDLIRVFSIGYGSPVAVRHRSISFPRRNLLLTRAWRSSIFSFSFVHSAGFGGVEGGGNDDDWPASLASSQLLFSDVQVLVLFAGDPFILESRASSLAFAWELWRRADYGGRAEVDLIYLEAAAAAEPQGGSELDLTSEKCNRWE